MTIIISERNNNELLVPTPGDRRVLMGDSPRYVKDTVHGEILLSSLAYRIINTREFKRLKRLNQLGNSPEVYPNATHSRFEHSLGVCHLATQTVEELKKLDENITQADKLCVEIAGLCHDLGHGPFSHLWEEFTRRAGSSWDHEVSSLELLDLLIENNDIKLEDYGLYPRDLVFIKELINGPLDKTRTGYPLQGRGPEKYFLYEIISNKLTGVDVDKWDYFLRDSKSTSINIRFTYARLINNMKIVDWYHGGYATTIRRIAYQEKVTEDCQDMFSDRSHLHRKVYQHKTVKVVDVMMIEAWLAADKHFPLINGRKLSEAALDVRSLVKMTDEMVNRTILDSEDPNLAKARNILERIERRQNYKILAEITGKIEKKNVEYEAELDCNSLAVAKVHTDMGKKEENPVTHILFFDKYTGETTQITVKELEHLAPSRVFYDKLFILLRDQEPSAEVLGEARRKVESLAEGKNWDIKWYSLEQKKTA